MTDYQIQTSTRRCATTGRELRPGERYYSVLLDEGGSFARRDYSVEAWQGPPPGALGFWQSKLNAASAPQRPPIDDELLMECFHRLEGEEDLGKQSFRYVLTLLLVRRRRLRLEEARPEEGREVLRVRCARTGARYEVPDPGMSDDELEAVQDDVFRALGWE
jgi:hypothetical protein